MKTFFSTVFIALLFFAAEAQLTDIQQLKQNLVTNALVNKGYQPRIERYVKPDYTKAELYMKNQNDKGGWNDIEYTDRDNNWHPLHHLTRLVVMTHNYSKAGSELFQSKELLSAIEKAISYWYEVNPECDNWYKNRIAKQFYFNVIALLTEGKIDESLHKKMVNDLTENPTMTGSNRTLLATSTFYKGVLENDAEKIKLGVSGVTDQIEVTTKEGIQPDYSFHQHGKFIYNGNYGYNFLRESAWMANMVHGTKFAFSDEHINILRNYFLEGTRWMIRGGLIDYNVRGRQVGRPDAMKMYANLLVPILEQLSVADPEFKTAYQTSIANIINEKPQDIWGNKHFWRSDYTVHHRDKFMSSVKMCSKRTVGIELNMNSENKLGYWLPYGLNYIYRKGNEYDGIFPVLDWARLPGITNPHIEIEEKGKGVAHTQQTEFVGGVSNGKYGISTMDFMKNETRAKKSWFWFNNEIVALGAGISSENENEINTTVNQCLLKNEVIVDGKLFTKKQSTIENPKWVLHDSIGYFFPGDRKINIKADVQKGNMQRIYGLGKDTVYTEKVFSLWFNHGVQPLDKNYEYTIIPGIDSAKMVIYSKNPAVWTILNTKQIQAVYHKNLQIFGLVFHEKGEFNYEGITINVDYPCLLLLDEKNRTFSISEPTTKAESIIIRISKKNTYQFEKEILLPQAGNAGKTVSEKF